MTPTTHHLTAVNTSFDSENRIHADDVARQYGFNGGLLPGVDAYGYLTWGPTQIWGRDWHSRGSGILRLVSPCYDHDEVTVAITDQNNGAMQVEAHRQQDGEPILVATLAATLCNPEDRPPPTAPALDAAPLPDPANRPPASEDSLRAGQVLGTVTKVADPAEAAQYCADVSEPSPLFTEIAHPGWILQGANDCLAMSVALGPWMHVGSRVDQLATIPLSSVVEWRSVVTDRYERSGHKFVANQVEVVVDGEVAQRIAHTSIYEPRRPEPPTASEY